MHASSRCVLHGDGHRDVPPSADMPVRVVSAQTVIVQTNGRMYVTSHGTFEWLIELTDRARTMKKNCATVPVHRDYIVEIAHIFTTPC